MIATINNSFNNTLEMDLMYGFNVGSTFFLSSMSPIIFVIHLMTNRPMTRTMMAYKMLVAIGRARLTKLTKRTSLR